MNELFYLKKEVGKPFTVCKTSRESLKHFCELVGIPEKRLRIDAVFKDAAIIYDKFPQYTGELLDSNFTYAGRTYYGTCYVFFVTHMAPKTAYTARYTPTPYVVKAPLVELAEVLNRGKKVRIIYGGEQRAEV